MKTLLSITAAATLFLSLPSWTCDLEEATEKREQLAKQVQQLTAQNPEKAKEINDGLRGMKLDLASKDLPDKCQLIEKRLQELKTAANKTGDPSY
jgi:ribosomal protein L22